MARTITLANLRQRAREAADQETGSNFIDNTELNAYINASYGHWQEMVATADPERFGATDTITATGAASYALPSDYRATLAIDYQEDSSEWLPLDRVTFAERNRFDESQSNNRALAYRLWAGTIILHPNPSSGTYRHLYVSAAPVLVADSDTVDGVNGWEEWIYLDAAEKILLKEESDPGMVMSRKRDIEAKIERAASDRDFGNADRISDVRTRSGYALNNRRWGRYGWLR